MSGGRNLPKGWRTDPVLAGLGTINNIGVHGFDLLRFLLGAEVTNVAVMTDQEPGFQVDTAAGVLIRFDNSTIAYVNANQSIPNPRDDVVLYGTEGRIVAENLSRPNREGTLGIIRAGQQQTQSQRSTAGAYAAAILAFSRAVAEGREPTPSGIDGLRSVQLTEAIAMAATEGRTVQLHY
jgi:predicted dehydrogenase